MVEWFLTALTLLGASHSNTAAAPSDRSQTTTQPTKADPSKARAQPACTDGKNFPPTIVSTAVRHSMNESSVERARVAYKRGSPVEALALSETALATLPAR